MTWSALPPALNPLADKRTFSAWIAQAEGVPLTMRLLLGGALGLVTDDDWSRYAGLLAEAVSALGETERGRGVLAQLGLCDGCGDAQ